MAGRSGAGRDGGAGREEITCARADELEAADAPSCSAPACFVVRSPVAAGSGVGRAPLRHRSPAEVAAGSAGAHLQGPCWSRPRSCSEL